MFHTVYLNLFTMGFVGLLTAEGCAKRAPLPKIWHTYPSMMKLGRVIPYLKKIKKTCKPRDTPLEFC